MNATDFIRLTGVTPWHDDLKRVNCPKAGAFGHAQCGLCPTCGQPRFMCADYETHEPDRFHDMTKPQP